MGEVRVCIANSVTQLSADVAGHVLVAASHGGLIAGALASQAGVRAVILNDAGGGLDGAGLASLQPLNSIGMAAAVIDRRTAPLGNAEHMWRLGVISSTNRLAEQQGVRIGMGCQIAAQLLKKAALPFRHFHCTQEGRYVLSDQPRRVVGCDSICLISADDVGHVLVIGSHSALHAGPPSALPVDAIAAFFHDAGSQGESEGISRLPVLNQRGIAAAAVNCFSARIGDAQSMYHSGVLSYCNQIAQTWGWQKGMTVRDAIQSIPATQELLAA